MSDADQLAEGSRQERPLLLDDNPVLLQGHTELPFGQQRIVQALLGHLWQGLAQLDTKRDGTPPTIALLGRYGQGKSSILRTIRAELHGVAVGGRWAVVRELDVASFRPDEVQYEFAKLIGYWYLRGRLLVWLLLFALPIFALATVIYYLVPQLKLGVDFPALLGASSALGLVGLLWFVARRLYGWTIAYGFADAATPAKAAHQHWLLADWRGLWHLLRGVLDGPPDVILIDNLDRATIEQQRAMLLAVRRERERLRVVIVVAFDDTLLTLDEVKSDAPSELLQKTFAVRLRLPPTTTRDARLLASRSIEAMQKINGGPSDAIASPVIALLDSIAVNADFARVLLLLRRHSVRFARQFLNDVVVRAAIMGIRHAAALSALIRFQGLFELVPWIQNEPRSIGDALNRQDDVAVVQLAIDMRGRALSPELTRTVVRYLALTRHMQPAELDWAEFAAPARGRRRSGQASGSAGLDSGAWPSITEHSHLFCNVRTGLNDEDNRLFHQAWIDADLSLAEASSPEARLLVLHELRGLPDRAPYVASPLPEMASDGGEATYVVLDRAPASWRIAWRFLLCRLWLADKDVLKLTAPADRDEWLLPTECLADGCGIRAADDPWADVELTDDDGDARSRRRECWQYFLSLLQTVPAQTFDRAIAGYTLAFIQPTAVRSSQLITAWLNECNAASNGDDLILTENLLLDPWKEETDPAPDLVVQQWPKLLLASDVSTVDWSAIMAESCSFGRLFRAGLRVRPRPLVAPLVHLARIGKEAGADFAASCLSLLHPLLRAPDAADPTRQWRRDLLDGLLGEGQTAGLDEVVRNWLDRLESSTSALGTPKVEDFWGNLYLACATFHVVRLQDFLGTLGSNTVWEFGLVVSLLEAPANPLFDDCCVARTERRRTMQLTCDRMAATGDLYWENFAFRLKHYL
jgi:hypothetical protein